MHIKEIYKNFAEHLFITGFFLGAIIFGWTITLWKKSKKSLLALFIIIILFFIILKILTYAYFKSIKTKKIKKKHVAILFVKYKFIKNLGYLLTKEKQITNILSKNNILSANYIIETKKQLEKILSNNSVQAVILLGHGRRHLLRLKDDAYYYCEFLGKSTNIKYVVQLHCNDGNGKSLYEIIDCNGYDTKDLTTTTEVNKFIFSNKLIKNLKKVFKK